MYPSPGFRYPRCPVTSAYTTTSYQDLHEKCWPDEQGEQDSDDASWPDSPASTRPTEVEDDAPDEQSWCELEDASENVNLLRGEDRFVRFREFAQIITIQDNHESISQSFELIPDALVETACEHVPELDEETLALWTQQHNAWREAEKARGWASSLTRWRRDRMPPDEVKRRARRCAESRLAYMKLRSRAVEWDDKLGRDAAMRKDRAARERQTPFQIRHAELKKAKSVAEAKVREREEEVARQQRAVELKAEQDAARARGEPYPRRLRRTTRRTTQVDPANDRESD